ncbi:MAG: hypothetical protein HETSPECPRED_000310 [Heterodermia speciosa]|uniref:Uncharacterized protein n=1 Tax=Heterodermia speciosa TaxID=116794 RepID=A0A8H3ERD2_9LECA|nr:MAG: hypothetical protein HETSPECPRED_000310 [Heterodermia speciosa]
MPDPPSSSSDLRASQSDPPAATNTINDYYHSLPLHSICTRVLDSGPESINPHERAFLLLRPDPSIEDSLYIARTSLTRRSLVKKALAIPDSEPPSAEPHLTKEEAGSLVWGVQSLSREEQDSRRKSKERLSDEERDLLKRARAALRTEEDKEYDEAGKIAFKIWQGYTSEERRQQRESDAALGKDPAVSFQERVVLPWERGNWMTLLQEKGYQSWGLPVLRTDYNDPAAWLNFKMRFTSLAREEVARVSASLVEGLQTLYIEDENVLAGAEQAGLLSYYTRARAEGKLDDGHHWGVFITYDAGVQERWSNTEIETLAPVWYSAWEADKVDQFGFPGALAVRPEMIWRTLMPKLVRGDIQPLEGLHMMASKS